MYKTQKKTGTLCIAHIDTYWLLHILYLQETYTQTQTHTHIHIHLLQVYLVGSLHQLLVEKVWLRLEAVWEHYFVSIWFLQDQPAADKLQDELEEMWNTPVTSPASGT